MMASPSRGSYFLLSAAASLGATVAVSYVLRRRRRLLHPSDEYLSSIRGNSRATGARVVSLYGRANNCSTTKGSDSEEDEGMRKLSLYVITGATSGLGLQTAMHLASLQNSHIILGCRNIELGGSIAKELNGEYSKSSIECIHLDLTSFASVKSFASSVIARSEQLGAPIHGLINNAGVYGVSGTTSDGYQITFQTNVLSHALLTELLLPYTSRDFRVVNVSSEMMKMVWNNTRKEGRAFPPIDGGDSEWDYALSKACQGLHAHELNLRWAFDNADGNAMNHHRRRAFAVEPGIVETNISRHLRSWSRTLNYLIFAPIVRTVDEGTATILFCLLAPEEHLDYGWPSTVGEVEDGDRSSVKPFYYANCMAKAPPRCCRRKEDAELQWRVFRDVFAKL